MQYVQEAVASTWISSLGKYLEQFEHEFASFCGCKYGVSVFNGTVALHLALHAHGIGPGDEVIVPDLSFIATANAVCHAGATPVFVDIDPFSLCLDATKTEAAITPRTKAIMPVHLYGHPADMEAILSIAERHDLLVIEDAAEAHGATLHRKKVGSFGHSAAFSFYGNKIITTGEGGMITTNDESFYHQCRYLRDHAMSKEKRYWHDEMGFNFRMTNLQAALGCAQMEQIESFLQKREQIFQWYFQLIGSGSGIELNRTLPGYTNSYWLICAEVPGISASERDALLLRLRELNVDTRPYFFPMSHMPYFTKADNPVSCRKSEIGFNLPTYTDMTEEEVSIVCHALRTSL